MSESKEARLKAARTELVEAYRAWQKSIEAWESSDRAVTRAYRVYNDVRRKVESIEAEP